jgi:hypothetical protein
MAMNWHVFACVPNSIDNKVFVLTGISHFSRAFVARLLSGIGYWGRKEEDGENDMMRRIVMYAVH